MYHFDYVAKRGGTVFENNSGAGMVTINGQTQFSFADFLNIFVLIEDYKHPFTLCTSAKRFKQIRRQIEKVGYTTVLIKQIDFDMGEENAFVYGAYRVNLPSPFRMTLEES